MPTTLTIDDDLVADLPTFLSRRPDICAGRVVIAGTRVIFETIIASLADGDSDEEILRDFPSVQPAQLRQVIGFAATFLQRVALPLIPDATRPATDDDVAEVGE